MARRLVLNRAHLIQLFDELLTMIELNDPTFEGLKDNNRVLTPLEALMRSAPGDAVETSQVELLALRELLDEALAELDDAEREAVLMTLTKSATERFAHRTPLRKAEINKPDGEPYSKSGIAKVRDRALEKLRRRLEGEPLVLQHIARNHATTEEEDGRQATSTNNREQPDEPDSEQRHRVSEPSRVHDAELGRRRDLRRAEQGSTAA